MCVFVLNADQSRDLLRRSAPNLSDSSDTRGMDMATHVKGHLLIAMPCLEDPMFRRTVSLICAHSAEGALGIIINRPLDEVLLGEVFTLMKIDEPDPDSSSWPIYAGGPVQRERGFIIHRPIGDWESSITVAELFGVTTSRDILMAIARGDGPREALVAFGYAGWGPGQLEQEICDNSWLSVPADPRVIFDVPSEERWFAAARLLGVDLSLLPERAGHA
jgi:putative transcriptional regulator